MNVFSVMNLLFGGENVVDTFVEVSFINITFIFNRLQFIEKIEAWKVDYYSNISLVYW